jgi:exodeoxyribonuclease VII small subunit
MSKQKSDKKESATYQQMLGELDDLVRQVSQGSMDLDDIVGRIEHGYKLIATMRERLDVTKARVEKLRVDFESPQPSSKSASTNTSAQDGDDDDDDAPF